MSKKYAASKRYLATHDDELREEALREAADTKKRWHTFLEGVVSVTRLITGPLFAVGGAALLAALTTNPVVPLAVGVGLLVAGAVSLVAAVASTHALTSLDRANAVEMADTRGRMQAKQVVQEIKANGICVTPETEVVSQAPSIGTATETPCGCAEKKNWTQTIQTAELDQAAQRSIH